MKINLLILAPIVLLCLGAKAQLTAEFTADTTSGCAPLTVNFSDLSTGSPTSWNWSFGDGSNSSLHKRFPKWLYRRCHRGNVDHKRYRYIWK